MVDFKSSATACLTSSSAATTEVTESVKQEGTSDDEFSVLDEEVKGRMLLVREWR